MAAQQESPDGCWGGGDLLDPAGTGSLLQLPNHLLIQELLPLLAPCDRRCVGQSRWWLQECTTASCTVLTGTEDMVQHALHQLANAEARAHDAPPARLPAWFGSLFQRFHNVVELRVACPAEALGRLLLFFLAQDTSRAASPQQAGAAALPATTLLQCRLLGFARGWAAQHPRHAAVAFASLVKHHVAAGDIPAAVAALDLMALDTLGAGHENQLPQQHERALLAQGYLPACDVRDDLCASACRVLQAHDPGAAAVFAQRIVSPLVWVPTWRWLVHFLLQPSPLIPPRAAALHITLASNALHRMTTDRLAFQLLQERSLTWRAEVARGILDASVAAGITLGLQSTALGRPVWDVSLYSDPTVYSAQVHRDGALERTLAGLITRRRDVDVVLLSAQLSFRKTAHEVWGLLCSAAGALLTWDSLMTAQAADRLAQVIPLLSEERHSAACTLLVRLLVQRGEVEDATRVAQHVAHSPSSAGIELWDAVCRTYCLHNGAVVAALSKHTLALVLKVAQSLEWGSAAAAALSVWSRGMAARGQLQQAYRQVVAHVREAVAAATVSALTVAEGDAAVNTTADAAAAAARAASSALAQDTVWCCLTALQLLEPHVSASLDCAGRLHSRALLDAPPPWTPPVAAAAGAGNAALPQPSLWQQLSHLVAVSAAPAKVQLLALAARSKHTKYGQWRLQALLQCGDVAAAATFLHTWCTTAAQWVEVCSSCCSVSGGDRSSTDGEGWGGRGRLGRGGRGGSRPSHGAVVRGPQLSSQVVELMTHINRGPDPQVACTAALCTVLLAEAAAIAADNNGFSCVCVRRAVALVHSVPDALRTVALEDVAIDIGTAFAKDGARLEAMRTWADLSCSETADDLLAEVLFVLGDDGAAEALAKMSNSERRSRLCCEFAQRMRDAGRHSQGVLQKVGRLLPALYWQELFNELSQVSSAEGARMLQGARTSY